MCYFSNRLYTKSVQRIVYGTLENSQFNRNPPFRDRERSQQLGWFDSERYKIFVLSYVNGGWFELVDVYIYIYIKGEKARDTRSSTSRSISVLPIGSSDVCPSRWKFALGEINGGGQFSLLVDAKGTKRNVDKYRDTTMEKERRKILKMFKITFKICPPLFAEIKRRKVQEESRRLKTCLTRIFSLFLFQVSRGWRILSKRAYFFQNFKTPSLQISNRYSILKLLCPFHEHHS